MGCAFCDGRAERRGKIEFHRCPHVLLRGESETVETVNYYVRHFRENRLPCSRGYMEHPAVFVAAMDHLESEASKIEAKRIEKAERKAKRGK
jgi:hypothetical protein